MSTGATRRRATLMLGDDAHSAFLLPGAPTAERSATGTPAVTLLGSELAAFLQIGAQWWPSSDDQGRLLDELAALTGVSVADLQLSSAGLTDVVASVQLVSEDPDASVDDGAALGRTLATSSTSLVPPYQAAMSASLSRDLVAQVRRAVEGQRGVVEVRFSGTATGVPFVSTVLTADPTPDFLATLRGTALPDAATAVEDMIPARVTRVRTGATDLDPTLAARADAAAAAALVRTALEPGKPDLSGGITTLAPRLLAIGTASAEQPITLNGVADIADWTAASPSQHVVLVGTGAGTTS